MKVNSIPNRLLAFTSKPTVVAVILRPSMQSNMPNFVFSIAIHHYIFALRDLILAKNHFMPDQPSSLTNVLRFEAQNKESGGGLADRLDRRWVLRRERGRIHIRTREKVQTLASERESGSSWHRRRGTSPSLPVSLLFSSHHSNIISRMAALRAL